MGINYLFKIILFFLILLEIKAQKPEKSDKNIIDLTHLEIGRKSHTIVLKDSNFDSIIRNGTENRWLIIFYSEACSMCKQVKAIIDKKKKKNI
jgi:thioredoxin-related protein